MSNFLENAAVVQEDIHTGNLTRARRFLRDMGKRHPSPKSIRGWLHRLLQTGIVHDLTRSGII